MGSTTKSARNLPLLFICVFGVRPDLRCLRNAQCDRKCFVKLTNFLRVSDEIGQVCKLGKIIDDALFELWQIKN
jgi:hypothetical protein